MFKIDVYTELSETAIVTKRNVKTTVIAMLSAILGSVVGIMNLSVLFMLKTEMISGKVKERLEKQRCFQELKEKSQMLRLKDTKNIKTLKCATGPNQDYTISPDEIF